MTIAYSNFWDFLKQEFFNDDFDVLTFKDKGKTNRISLGSPDTYGVRYFKYLTWVEWHNATQEVKDIVINTTNRDIGGTYYSIETNRGFVDLDYIRSAKEVVTISSIPEYDRKVITEIGAGYGRTAHAILENLEVDEYFIVDIEPCITLSKAYLREALDRETYEKLTFIKSSSNHVPLGTQLTINIDSMSEFDMSTFNEYIESINKVSKWFFSCNYISKYNDPSLGSNSSIDSNLAVSAGPTTQVINIFNEDELAIQLPAFIDSYRPSKTWHSTIINWNTPFPNLWEVVYKNERY
jgi:hypothetical protein